jgi:hypothetical protein
MGGTCSERVVDDEYKFFVGKYEWKKPLEDLVVDGRIILKWILGKQGSRVWIRLIWLRIGASGGFLSTQ